MAARFSFVRTGAFSQRCWRWTSTSRICATIPAFRRSPPPRRPRSSSASASARRGCGRRRLRALSAAVCVSSKWTVRAIRSALASSRLHRGSSSAPTPRRCGSCVERAWRRFSPCIRTPVSPAPSATGAAASRVRPTCRWLSAAVLFSDAVSWRRWPTTWAYLPPPRATCHAVFRRIATTRSTRGSRSYVSVVSAACAPVPR